MRPNAIELRGGPLNGVIHEFPAGLPVGLGLPDAFALPDKDQRHWYAIAADGVANFLRSEPITPADSEQ